MLLYRTFKHQGHSAQEGRPRPWALLPGGLIGGRVCVCVCVCVCVLSCSAVSTLCHLMDCSLPGSLVHGILQARILEWVALPFCRGTSPRRDRARVSCVSCIGRQILFH